MIANICAITQTRDMLEQIKAELVSVTKCKALFSLADFQAGAGDSDRQPMQRLHKDADGQYALYMSTSISDQKPPPNHVAWAVIVGILGEDRNWLFERANDDAGSGNGARGG